MFIILTLLMAVFVHMTMTLGTKSSLYTPFHEVTNGFFLNKITKADKMFNIFLAFLFWLIAITSVMSFVVIIMIMMIVAAPTIKKTLEKQIQ